MIDFIDTYEKADDCRIKEMNKWLLANGIITCMFMNTTNTKNRIRVNVYNHFDIYDFVYKVQ